MSKEPKPTTNLLVETTSHHNKFKRRIANLPNAKNYRIELEPLLGAVCTVVCKNWSIKPDVIDGKECDRLYLYHANVMKAPKSREVKLPITVHHIWTAVDSEWKNRVGLTDGRRIKIKGFIYLYNKGGKKNIGLQALSLQII